MPFTISNNLYNCKCSSIDKFSTIFIMASPTRLSTNTKLIALVGPGKEFVPSDVPTLRAVIQKGILLQQDSLQSRNTYLIKEIAKDLAQLILEQ